MKEKNKHLKVKGAVNHVLRAGIQANVPLDVIITNDEVGKTLSIDNGIVQFTIPFEPIEKYLK